MPIYPAKDLEEVAAIASAQENTSTTPATPSKTPKKELTTTTVDRDQRITAAESQAQKYRESKRRPCTVGLSALRAYYIWRNNTDLKPEGIAKLLREPPLQTNTVVGYILSSITAETLPYEKKRVQDELLAALAPGALKSSRYQALVKECQTPGGDNPPSS